MNTTLVEQKQAIRGFGWIRRLYHWVLSWADSPWAAWVLLVLAFAEASFFPIPPDVLLIALCLGKPGRSLWYAVVCSVGSIAGAAAGYWIGLNFFEVAGRPILEFYGAMSRYAQVQELYQTWDVLAVMVAGFTPIPFKVFTIAAGVFELNFSTFLGAALVSRAARFLLVAALIWWNGPQIRDFIERYFNWLTWVFTALLLGGFVVLKYAM
ncbi:MAG TPA: YqaA family protein [Acidobacteriota bacterium]|nr:YqaA family protein [Acidobacteriota bacterium]HRR27279.1 YqaA family protein [Acidobacteriota bacterium]HRR57836.1 YqaA family protein [Acidobacteriota bacterium]HRV08342.1 YqaA family protein [Acidobacteriota bacterium]